MRRGEWYSLFCGRPRLNLSHSHPRPLQDSIPWRSTLEGLSAMPAWGEGFSHRGEALHAAPPGAEGEAGRKTLVAGLSPRATPSAPRLSCCLPRIGDSHLHLRLRRSCRRRCRPSHSASLRGPWCGARNDMDGGAGGCQPPFVLCHSERDVWRSGAWSEEPPRCFERHSSGDALYAHPRSSTPFPNREVASQRSGARGSCHPPLPAE
jgi:hypothetical protein